MVRTHAITDRHTDRHTHRLRLTVYAETHSTRRQEAVGYKKVLKVLSYAFIPFIRHNKTHDFLPRSPFAEDYLERDVDVAVATIQLVLFRRGATTGESVLVDLFLNHCGGI